mgnify:FL=1
MPHIHEKIDFTVEVFVVFQNKVLLRKHDKYNIWLSVGGHIELDEDPNQAALREVKEEVGLEVALHDTREVPATRRGNGFTDLVPPVGMNRHDISDGHEHISLLYFASAISDQVVPEKPTDEWRWCTKDEIETLTPITEDVVRYAKKALELLKD